MVIHSLQKQMNGMNLEKRRQQYSTMTTKYTPPRAPSSLSFNAFKQKNKAVTETFQLVLNEFPQLQRQQEQEQQKQTQTQTTFSDILKKETEQEETKKVSLEPGWVRYTLGPHNIVEIEYNKDEYNRNNKYDSDEYNEYEEQQDYLNSRAIAQIIINMDRYKNDFIELHGQDEYDRVYQNYRLEREAEEYEEEEDEYEDDD